jgi:2-polyprenyl-3-methyl-5-hydroxy-6-metoxy-1,4-benzoquinol methylase
MPMGEEVVALQARPARVRDGYGEILRAAAGKRVLNVGAAGNVERYLPGHEADWLHWQIQQVAGEAVGTDIDGPAVAHARRHGYDLRIHNCEDEPLDGRFDVIVMADVLEHVERPGPALANLVAHLAPGGRLLVTTPNPQYYATVARAALGLPLNVFWDHTLAFMPENLQAWCNRHGHRLAAVKFYTPMDRRSGAVRVKSLAGRLVGAAFPRLNAAFLAEIEAGTGTGTPAR